MKINYELEHMETAVKLAKYALDHGETPVACIFVHEPTNSIIAFGMNDTNRSRSGTSHAEFMGIGQILELQKKNEFSENTIKFEDITLYVTVEPCIMCASAIQQIGIKKVVFGCGNDRFGGNGSVLSIQQNSYVVLPGILRKEAVLLLRNFYVMENDHAPEPRTKSNRKLDLQEFPPIPWKNYISDVNFKDTFGETKYQEKFNSMEDLISGEKNIKWDLLEKRYDDILETLNGQIAQKFTHKKQCIVKKV
ncbi:hypothetical protein ACO0QE_000561 [Hanseniaspora vineae]